MRRVPGVAIAVDVVLFSIRDGRFSVLLVRRNAEPFEVRWALPGGLVKDDESLEQAVLRELAAETGLVKLPAAMHLEQLRTYGAPGRDPRRRTVSVAYMAFLPDLPAPEAGGDTPLALFWPVSEVTGPPAMPLAFDHPRILEDGVERARGKLEYTSLAASFLEEPFRLGDLRRIYEEVWATRLDPSNFRRKVLNQRGFVVPHGLRAGSTGPRGGRPAELYGRGDAFLLWPPLRRDNDELNDPTEGRQAAAGDGG